MRYEASRVPGDVTKQDFLRWLQEELTNISIAMGQIEGIMLDELHAEPSKPRNGMIVLADGTDWNPGGTGAGFYGRSAGAWVKLG